MESRESARTRDFAGSDRMSRGSSEEKDLTEPDVFSGWKRISPTFAI